MILHILKCDGSLALPIPGKLARQIGLREGSQVQVNLTVDGGISIRAVKWDRRAFAHELETMRDAMPMTEAVTDELRRAARY